MLILTSSTFQVDVDGSTWTKNGVGLQHSHQHGFGIMDAWRLVNAAKVCDGFTSIDFLHFLFNILLFQNNYLVV